MEIATGRAGVECFLEHSGRIFEAEFHGAAVDEVELLRVEPFIFRIVDFKPAISRYASTFSER